jgi:hypothetical protein
LGGSDQWFDGFHSAAKVAPSFQRGDPMGLNRGSQANDAGRALNKIMDESKAEQSSEECSGYQGYRVVDEENEGSEEGEETPESRKN